MEISNRPRGRISRSLAFWRGEKGEARTAAQKGPKPLRWTPMSDSPARRETPPVLNLSNRRIRDPYVRWCGRGGVARLPPIPIEVQDTFSRYHHEGYFVGRAVRLKMQIK